MEDVSAGPVRMVRIRENPEKRRTVARKTIRKMKKKRREEKMCDKVTRLRN